MACLARCCLLVWLTIASSAFALNLKAALDGAQETPPSGSAATGLGTISYNLATHQLTWSVQYSGLTSVTAAHFHKGAVGEPGPIVVDIGSGGLASPMSGSVVLNATQEGELLSGQWYLNIHTTAFTGGEIRGQVGIARTKAVDFNGGGKSDVFWRHPNGANYIWEVNGSSISGGVLAIEQQGLLPSVDSSWAVVGIGDFNGDGKADLLFRRGDGTNYVWHVDGSTFSGGLFTIVSQGLLPSVPSDWYVAGIGDFNGDGKDDILWRQSGTGTNYIWHVDGASINGGILSIASQGLLPGVPGEWNVAGIGDFNGDGRSDILWRRADGVNFVWNLDGSVISGGLVTIASQGQLPTADQTWNVAGIGDFDANGKSDILWRKSDGTVYIWNIDSSVISGGLVSIPSQGLLPSVDDSWTVVGTGDYNGDGKSDIFFRKSDGTNYVWHVDSTRASGGLFAVESQGLLPSVDTSWITKHAGGSPVQQAAYKARRTLEALGQTINTKGAALATADVEALADAGALDNGLARHLMAANISSSVRGVLVRDTGLLRIAAYNEVADALFATFFLSTDAGTLANDETHGAMGFVRQPDFGYPLWGNRFTGEAYVALEFVIQNFGTPTAGQQQVNAGFAAPQGTVASVVITGGPFSSTPIPQSPGSRLDTVQGDPAPAPPDTIRWDTFNLTSVGGLPAATYFTLATTPPSGPPSFFKVLSNSPTNQPVVMTAPTGHSIAAVAGTTVAFAWTLPGYAISEVHIGGQVRTAVSPNPGTSCLFGELDLASTATGVSIAIPSSCDSQPVLEGNVVVNVIGVNGERSSYMYGFQ